MAGNAVVLNFAGGETSPRSRGRFDQPWYQTSARKLLNFISDLQGPARFRPGFVYSRQTRQGQSGRLIDFQVSDVLGYVLELTPGYMRVYDPIKQELLTTTSATITGISNAAQGVVTVSSITGISNGDEVLFAGVVGMNEINNGQYTVANISGNTFKIKDSVTGAYIDTSAYGVYSSGGTAKKVYELATPWGSTELPNIQWSQNSKTMYVVCPTQPPQKITVDGSNNFTIATFSRTNDPFQSAGVLTLTGIVLGTKTLVTFVSGPSIVPNINYTFAGVVGTTQINGGVYQLKPVGGSYQVSLLLGGTAGPEVADGIKISLDTLGGALNSQLQGTQVYVKVIAQEAGFTTVLLYSDAGLTQPIYYTGSSDGNFNAYKVGGGFTIKSGAHTNDTGSISEAWGTFGGATLEGYIQTAGGADIDSSAWTAYVSGGTATPAAENPLAVAFYEGRLGYFGTNQRPDCIFLSRAPDNNGNSRYDDFTGGTAADFACFFQLAPTGGSTSYISWARGGPDYLFLGTFGGPYRVSGSGLDIPITPTSINVRQFDTAGCEETMAAGCQQIFFIQQGGQTLRSIKIINPYLATFESADMALNAEQIGYSPLQRVVLLRGRPDALWMVRKDGLLVGMSVKITTQTTETLTGWHRHQLGGVNPQAVDLVVSRRQSSFDQLWVMVSRTVNGATRCYIEIMADDVYFPDLEDFFSGAKATDLSAWQNAIWRLQEKYVHMDAELAYDGSLRGTAAAATLTPSAVGPVNTSITLTASQNVFSASDVGSEIWVKPNATTGIGAGRAKITAYTDAKHVTATVSVVFNSTGAVAAGDWYFAVSTFYGFEHLEGAKVAVVADGAVVSDGGEMTSETSYPTITVSKGTITLPQGDLGVGQFAAVLRAGLPYQGIIESHNLEMGGRSGPAQAKPRNIAQINMRFMNSLGVEYGTDPYNMAKIEQRLSDAISDRPAPVFSGIRKLQLQDSWSGLDDATREKNITVCQRLPLPAIVESVDISYETTDEGVGV